MDETESPERRLFLGSEFPRLLLLAVLMLGGWAYVWLSSRAPRPAREAPPVVDGPPAPIEPDRAPEFETVRDKTVLSFRDSAAYARLLRRAAATTPSGLASETRRDLSYAQLWTEPAKFRGVPVHVLGTARQVLNYPSKLSRTGWLYEAWVFSPDSHNHPIVCVFEDAPRGLPVGPNISERVVFNGYFLKLMRYEAGDTPRAAPLLVGRIGWEAAPVATAAPAARHWLAGAVGLMFLVSLGRWAMQLRNTLLRRPSQRLAKRRPTEEIHPDDLAEWVLSAAAEPDDASRPPRDKPA